MLLGSTGACTCVSAGSGFWAALPPAQLARSTQVSSATIDRAVTHLLRAKFEAGLFENPYVDPDYVEKLVNNADHQKLALKAAHEAIILLKNQNSLLPLDKSKYKRIAVRENLPFQGYGSHNIPGHI